MSGYEILPDEPAPVPAGGGYEVLPDEPGILDTAAGVGKAALSGLDKGVAGLAGAPADAAGLAQAGVAHAQAWAQGRPYEEVRAENDAKAVIPRSTLEHYGSEALHARSGLAHKPQNRAERFVETAAAFLPGGMLGPGGVARNAVAFGVLPGVASEAAGQLTEGSKAEPFTRAGAAMATALAAGLTLRPGGAGRAIAHNTRGVTPAQFDAAEALFQEAHAAGLPITRAEAVQHATNGATRLGDVQRVVEGQGGLKPFFAERPGQVEAAGRQAFDRITPATPAPFAVGPAASRAAEGTILDMEAARAAATSPHYRAAATETVPTERMSAFLDDLDRLAAGDKTGVVGQKVTELRSLLTEAPARPGAPATRTPVTDPKTGAIIRYETTPAVAAEPRVPITDIENLDRARKHVRDKVGAPQIGAEAITKEQAATVSGKLGELRGMMLDASPEFRAGKELHAQITRDVITPAQEGMLGRLARTPETKAAIEALFPRNPLPNSAGEIAGAVKAVVAKQPAAARQLVRLHAESVFNQATRDLQAGANQFGGAGFAAAIRGNAQQAANLESAVRALPGGDGIWGGFDRFLTILEAQGTRQRIGSQTAFNTEMQRELSGGKAVGDAMSILGGAGVKFPSFVRQKFEAWRLGNNVDELARLLTDPQAGPLFRQLAQQRGGTGALALTTRLTAIAARGYNSRAGAPPSEGR